MKVFELQSLLDDSIQEVGLLSNYVLALLISQHVNHLMSQNNCMKLMKTANTEFFGSAHWRQLS